MTKVRTEQMTIFSEQPKNTGDELPVSCSTTPTTKKHKKSTNPTSKYKVKVGSEYIHDVIDYVSPSIKCPFWTFITSDNRHIEASGNIIVEAN